ncbi:hypothetical protein XccvBFoX4_gp80 [Xanthomonas phage FoX4]|uniref:Uncharacterized protein n=1 Tax=Xanthomonas phage FoX4 TaxID=2723900 RepID=A0A858WHS2_9CAUD|nr:hypothetical protein KNU97_gp80 [Xanthomonas phage FoX4]QJI53034.1 hypothetical protein XccvBFoX4_gp80 [Xanthomonas phage FoX4]
MTHAELSKVLWLALTQAAAHLITNTPCSYDELPDCITDALKQYDNTSQPARRNRREAQRARLCVDALAGLTDAQVGTIGGRMQHALKCHAAEAITMNIEITQYTLQVEPVGAQRARYVPSCGKRRTGLVGIKGDEA